MMQTAVLMIPVDNGGQRGVPDGVRGEPGTWTQQQGLVASDTENIDDYSAWCSGWYPSR
ncbi:MAG: hypothetical protein JW940_35105 [Polyangiaceae bacterium]|nr:hypothetical protein [Polyangiaceae bacterium]